MPPFAYDPAPVEAKWQKKWEEAGTYVTPLSKPTKPFYNLVMFPYPSGDKLHVGHWYNYAPADTFGRFMRMKGYDVFTPMGFDAFGLPAENYAVKTGVFPATSTANNVANMIEQLKRLGCMYDWGKTVCTTDPSYYRWTQWLFLQMQKHGLAERRLANVNWCPKDQTVLAREQCQDGTCERCGTAVIQKPLTQWFWKITNYADALIDHLDGLDWPEKTKTMQRHWIGRSQGAEIAFEIPQSDTSDRSLAGGLNPRLTRTVHLVFTPKHRQSSFEEQKSASKFLEILDEVAHRYEIQLHEAAVMPDHVHLLISFSKERNLEHDIVKKIKGASAYEYLPKSDGEVSHLWGEGKHFVEIETDAQFHSVLSYIRNNPKEAGIDPQGRLLSTLSHFITVFTTRPDTLFGVTYIVLAPEHPLVERITPKDHWGAVQAYREKVASKTELQRTDLNKDKTGVPTGAFALHPVTGEKLPIWIADYVLASYGTGAVMAVPAHDERDWIFAKTYGLPMREVVKGGDIADGAFGDEGITTNSDFLEGLHTSEAKKKMIAWLEDEEKGRGMTQYRLKDWLVSRQRYWGAPIPIVYDPEGNAHPIPEKHLPWLLPTDVAFKPTGESPLHLSKEFKERTEKIFGKGWTPEYDTMDTFVCSSFYYLRYLAEGNEQHVVDPHVEKAWMPVDMYIGGPEHACMHLIYARFVMMALKDFGFVSHDEPFQRLVHQGLITNKGAKMSKSKGNVVSPDAFVERHGADVFRMYLMFMGPFTEGGDWNDTGIKGIDRFVQRVYKIFTQPLPKGKELNKKIEQSLHATIKRVTESIEKLQFNTAISALMELLNAIEGEGGATAETAATAVRLLAPLAPHLAEELWESLGKEGFVIDQAWPHHDPLLLVADSVTIAIQVNGKLRGDVTLPAAATKEEMLHAAKENPNAAKFLEGHRILKEIYVPGKLVNIVVEA